MTPEEARHEVQIKSGLDYAQRKALRRLGRGQTINRTMRNDPVIRECYSTEHYIYPPREMNIAEWCDWEAKARHINRPRLNSHGKKLLKELEMQE